MADTDLLTKADLGARLQISRATLNRWLRDGALPPPLPTPTARWIWDDVLEHLKGLRDAAGDDGPIDGDSADMRTRSQKA